MRVGSPHSPSAVHLRHLRLLLFLGTVASSGFNDAVEVSCPNVGTHLKQLHQGHWKSIHFKSDNDNDDYQQMLSNLGSRLLLSIIDLMEKSDADYIFVGDVTHQQPATVASTSCGLMLQLVAEWLPGKHTSQYKVLLTLCNLLLRLFTSCISLICALCVIAQTCIQSI